MKHRKTLLALAVGAALAIGLSGCGGDDEPATVPPPAAALPDPDVPPVAVERSFKRVASFPVCAQVGSSCEGDTETAAEIVAASGDGNTLIYSNSPLGAVGFVDITDPAAPAGLGSLDMGGEPTSVAVLGATALVAVNTSVDFVNPTGKLVVVDIASRTIVTELPLPGQPDSIAVSKDKAYVAIVIENERDEDLGTGEPPQLPAGSLVLVDAAGDPAAWTQRNVDLTGLATLFPDDPEPEYVSINDENVAVVTLQENNHIMLVDLASGAVIGHYTAGTVSLDRIDASDNRPAVIALTESLADIAREPDGAVWLNTAQFATADEGDLYGGSRGFTVFNRDGTVAWAAGNLLEHETVRLGHYPDRRSDAKGNEPENVAAGSFEGKDHLFVASERSSLVFVFDAADPVSPKLVQALPAGVAPEGLLAIPSRNLLVAASEADSRADAIRSVLNIYSYTEGAPVYPTLKSADRVDGTPIPWGAISGLAASPTDASRVFAIDDSFYASNRIFGIDLSKSPAIIDTELNIRDTNGVLAALPVPKVADVDPTVTFDSADLAKMINADGTVNLDPEGIAVASDGGFWIASEGAGTVGEATRPITSHNLVVKVDASGTIERVITLPADLNDVQLRFGLEGITESDGKLVVAFQRAWNGEANPRLGIYDLGNDSWSFVYYPLDARESPNAGWVGLSDITALGSGQFVVVERDNQGGPDARIKRLYRIDLTGVAAGATVTKTLVRNLLADLKAPGGPVPEKIEGLAVLADGKVVIVNDNDGVNDNSGETQLLNLGAILAN